MNICLGFGLTHARVSYNGLRIQSRTITDTHESLELYYRASCSVHHVSIGDKIIKDLRRNDRTQPDADDISCNVCLAMRHDGNA